MNNQIGSRAHIIVSGRVQGVFYRSSTRKKAHSLGLEGFVKNLADGTVEIMVEGSKSDIQQLISWSHKGPPSARVDSVDVDWMDPTNEFSGFSIRY